MEKERIILFNKEEDCCGCGACMNICPKNAISMAEDEYGFLYPVINHEMCIRCGMCKTVCVYQNGEENTTANCTYAAVACEKQLLMKSASGGVFSALAKEILNADGAVFGCSMERYDGKLCPEHIMVESADKLYKLQGSKYVQSDIGDSYRQVKSELTDGRKVLFSGTPCQVAGLKGYLGGKTYKNLFTVDIICHGVPNACFFKNYISVLEGKLYGKVIDFSFRDKTKGWGMYGCAEYKNKRGRTKRKIIPMRLSSYYSLFLGSDIYRQNCYECKYAGPNRTGDLTIGDYWGIEKEHKDYLIGNGGDMDENKGISCVLVNTEQGKELLNSFGNGLVLHMSEFQKAANQNAQLKHPSSKGKNREIVLELYKNGGYAAVEKWFQKKLGAKKYLFKVWELMPISVKRAIKKFAAKAE